MRMFLAATAVLLLALPISAEASWRGHNGEIVAAYDRELGGGEHVAGVVAGTTVLNQRDLQLCRSTLDPSCRPLSEPQFRRDGSELAFELAPPDFNTFNGLAITDTDGNVINEIRDPAGNDNYQDPSWSRDGRLLFVDQLQDVANYQLVTSNPAGLDRHVLGGATEGYSHPVWSPQGGSLVVTRGIDLVRLRPGHPGSRLVARSGWNADWSPSGRSLVYIVRDPHGHARIVISRPDGTHKRTLRPRASSGDIQAVAWSPDGRRIAFATVGSIRIAVWTVAAGGGRAHLVLAVNRQDAPTALVRGIAWQPLL